MFLVFKIDRIMCAGGNIISGGKHSTSICEIYSETDGNEYTCYFERETAMSLFQTCLAKKLVLLYGFKLLRVFGFLTAM